MAADGVAELADAVDVGWVLVCTALVFWEQAGFAMLEAGSVSWPRGDSFATAFTRTVSAVPDAPKSIEVVSPSSRSRGGA